MSEGSPQQFASRYYRSEDGLRLHYQDYAGPDTAPYAVICLPGLTRNARDFEDLAPYLARRFRVLSLDFRGRGLSEYAADPMSYVPMSYVRDLNSLMRDAGVSRAVLIGSSLGGLVATAFSALHPQSALGIILNDVGPDVNPVGLKRIASYVGNSDPIATWQEAADSVRAKDGPIYPGLRQESWLRLARRRFVQSPDGIRLDYDLNIAKAFALPATNPDQWPFFRQLPPIPVLVLRGAVSDILSSTTVERMKAVVPTLQAVEVPNRGHVPLLDEPEALGAIDLFLAQVPGFSKERIGRPIR